MAISGNQTQYCVINREIEFPYEDILQEFDDQSIPVNDTSQIFTIILRTNGRDTILGEMTASDSLVFQFKEVTTPSEL